MSPRRLAEKPALYIFHISREGARPAFLHSLKDGKEFVPLLENHVVRGRYGKEPRVESITLLRGDLYGLAENALRQWVSELRFIPRFLISAGVFLAVYFFASFVIRDPLPMIDELLIAGAASVITYILVGKRFLSSRAAEEKRNDLHTIIDGIAFTESPFVMKVEGLLAALDAYSREELLRIYNRARAERQDETADADTFPFPELLPEWEEEALALEACLAAVFKEKGTKNFDRRLEKKLGPQMEKTLEALNRLISGTRIDFPLFVFFTLLCRALEASG
jgi:hypothetical protein